MRRQLPRWSTGAVWQGQAFVVASPDCDRARDGDRARDRHRHSLHASPMPMLEDEQRPRHLPVLVC